MGEILLVNKWNPLPDDYEPAALIDLWKMQPRSFFVMPWVKLLARDAAQAANKMFSAASNDGLRLFAVCSAYRERACQAKLHENRERNSLAVAPGESEHETGLAMDVCTVGRSLALEGPYKDWIHERCWEFGFIPRYPAGKEDVTGVPCEPWHFRYIGEEAAIEMRGSGLALEEYLAVN